MANGVVVRKADEPSFDHVPSLTGVVRCAERLSMNGQTLTKIKHVDFVHSIKATIYTCPSVLTNELDCSLEQFQLVSSSNAT